MEGLGSRGGVLDVEREQRGSPLPWVLLGFESYLNKLTEQADGL